MTLGGRRSVPRLATVSEPRGILDALEPLSVRSLSPDGLRIESPHPLEAGSIHEFQLFDGAASVRVRAAVRHVSPLRLSSAGRYFLVDLAFLDLDARSSVVVEQWLKGQSAQPTRKGV
jgi:hypothetical protein